MTARRSLHDRPEAARSRRLDRDRRHVRRPACREAAHLCRASRTRSSSPKTGREDAQREVLDLLLEHLPRGFPSAIGGRRAADRRRSSGTGRAETRVAAAAPRRLAAGAGRPDPDAPRRGRLAARRGIALLSVVLAADGKIRQADAGDPRAGAGFRAGHAQCRAHRPHVRQAAGRPAGRALQLVDPGGRRALSPAVQRRAHRPRHRPAVAISRSRVAAHAFIRVERQTLRKLPVSGDILFTIRIYLDPMAVLRSHPDRAALARLLRRAAGGARRRDSSTTRG